MDKKYNIIYADPPWQYYRNGVQGSAEKNYRTMPIDDICALPVSDITADDALLFIWATFPKLPEVLKVIKAWGFKYKSVAFYGSNKIKAVKAGFTVSDSGQEVTQRYACLPQKVIQNGSRKAFINLSLVRCENTVKSLI